MNYSIVVVDDDSFSLTYASSLLSEEKMKVTCLTSGRKLLDYVKDNTPDLILMDIVMPDIDGFDTYILLRRFEKRTGRSPIPVIFTSGQGNSEIEELGLVLGGADFISKPFTKDVLIRRINNTIKNNKMLETLTEEATLDKLTGFFNKAKGTERVAKLCKRKRGALVVIDLDSFKLVNDLFGHDSGDSLLRVFAEVIKKNTRETDTLCRIGGDEFMAFFEDLTDERGIRKLSTRFNAQFEEEAKNLLGEDHGLPLGISLGVAMVPQDGTEYDTLFSIADAELYKVKQNGKHGYSIHGMNYDDDEDVKDSIEVKLDRLIKTLEERNEKDGALLLGKDSFAIVYKYVMRYFRRYGGSAALLFFDLDLGKADDSVYYMEAVSSFYVILEKNLRMSDVVMQNGAHSFFCMLTECTEKEIETATERVIKAFDATEYARYVKVSHVYRYLENKH